MYVKKNVPTASATAKYSDTTKGENCGYSPTLLLGFMVTPIPRPRIPTLGRFWDLKRTKLRKMPVSGL